MRLRAPSRSASHSRFLIPFGTVAGLGVCFRPFFHWTPERPLPRRITTGDWVIHYSPVSRFGGKDRLQAFTVIGTVVDAVPCQVEVAAGSRPWRRDMRWDAANAAPVRLLPGRLAFTGDGTNRGYRFRFGLFGITGEDAAPIATAMMADVTGSTDLSRQPSRPVGADLAPRG